MALDFINADPNILPDYDLQLLIQDTKCMVDVAMTQFLKLVIDTPYQVAGIIGMSSHQYMPVTLFIL